MLLCPKLTSKKASLPILHSDLPLSTRRSHSPKLKRNELAIRLCLGRTIAVLTCGEAGGKAKLSPQPRSQVQHLVAAHIVRRNKVLDEVSTAIARDRVARNAELTCVGWRVFCSRKKPDDRRQVQRFVRTRPCEQSSRLKCSPNFRSRIVCP